jgi:PAS domain-containing protein
VKVFFIINLDWWITSFNRTAEKITDVPREKAVVQYCRDDLRVDVCETDCTLAAANP